ncbi:MAG: transcription termination factor NusA [Sphaerochaeta sp.]
MATDIGDAIRSMVAEKNISEELVISTIEDILRAAYKRKFGTDENAVIEFSEDFSSVELASRRQIVDDDEWYNEVTEIPLSEAKEIHEECEIGDELLIPVDLKEFDRISVQSAKQRAHQSFRDIQKDTLYSEFKAKEGQLIIGYYRRQAPNGDIYVDIGSTEGLLPRRNQSSRESYQSNDKIKCYVESVEKAERGVRVILSRTSSELIRKLFEVEVPEIAQNQIDVIKIVREAGYRTKVAVASRNDDIDPVGACVGLKGNRIQTIMSEIEGEKIDILRYDPNPINYIRNALSPAQVKDVVVLDKNIYHAVAIVEDSQLSLAIGKQGLNVRLANKLVDWMIDVKTQAQFDEMDIAKEARFRAESIFMDEQQEYYGEEFPSEGEMEVPEVQAGEIAPEESFVDEDEIALSELPLDEMLLKKLHFHDVYSVEEFINLSEEDIASFSDLSEEEIIAIKDTINEYVDIVEDEEETETEYVCPNCGSSITEDMNVCPNCGTGLVFEVE